jgi:hypothetical protein
VLEPLGDRGEDLAGDLPTREPVVDTSRLREIAVGARQALRDAEHGEIGQHLTHWGVGRHGALLAPRRERSGDGTPAWPERAHVLQPLPRVPRRRSADGPGEQLVARLHRPLGAPEPCELGGEAVAHVEQVRHVGRRVLALVGRQRTPQPVREAVALDRAHAQLALEQRDERGRPVADEPRSDLGVVQAAGHRADGVREHVEVLLRRVQHGEHLAVEQPAHRRHVDGERIDEHEPARPGELEERELREVRAFAVELGVERVARLVEQLVDHRLELVLAGDPPVVERRVAHVGPVTMARPERSHASMPPATFTTSMPSPAR